MTKAELLVQLEELPDDFDIMIDGEGLSDVAELTVDEAAGTIVIMGT